MTRDGITLLRRGLLAGSVAVVVWAGAVVPMPVYEVQPGGAHRTSELVEISTAAGPINGDLRMLTIRQRTPGAFEALRIALDPDRELLPDDDRTPPGIDLSTLRAIQAEQFSDSFTIAVAVAARTAGYDVTIRTRAVVAQILEGGPADGLLQPGDRIAGVDGTPITTGAELVELLTAHDGADPVALDVVRDEVTSQVAVQLGEVEGLEHPGLGIAVETLTEAVELPFDASLAETNVVGASAGMMIALTTLDLLLEEDLTRGRVIAGTGTIDVDGTVGRIGGMAQKVRGALATDADMLLVPLEQLDEARDALVALEASDDIELVGVATIDDVLAAVRR